MPGLEGSLQVEMLAAARSLGRIAYRLPPEPQAVLAELEAARPVLVLLNLGLPAVPVWHYAVVVGFDAARNRIVLRSGRERRQLMAAPAWLRRWDRAGRWAVVLLRPGEWPAPPEREPLLRAFADFEDSSPPGPARQAWQTVVERWPDEPLAWIGLGNAESRLGDGEAARTAYRRALHLDPERLAARLNLAHSYEAEGRACEGLEALGRQPDESNPLRETWDGLAAGLRAGCSRSARDR